MSVEAIAIALHHSRATGAAKLVLLGIANHDGDGGAWPSVATLAKYAGVDRRNVQRALAKLEQLGEIRRHVQQGGDWRTDNALRPNLYDFTLECPWDCDRSKHHRTRYERAQDDQIEQLSTGAASAPPGGVSAARGAASAPPEPSLNQTHTKTFKSTSPIYRGRAREHVAAGCGHDLIDDRHCVMGCKPHEIGTVAS